LICRERAAQHLSREWGIRLDPSEDISSPLKAWDDRFERLDHLCVVHREDLFSRWSSACRRVSLLGYEFTTRSPKDVMRDEKVAHTMHLLSKHNAIVMRVQTTGCIGP
jgi:hypothetical protein